MKRDTIENILNFLEEKEGKELPESWFDSIEKFKLIEELENHPDGTQYRYEDHLELNNSNITKLPNDLYVGGSLNLQNCTQLTKLPDNLYVSGSLGLDETNITEIPNNLYVGHSLFIKNTPLAKKYSNEKIREMITSKGGTIIGNIYDY